MALRDTLANLQQQAEQRAQWERDRPQVTQDWRDSVNNLITDIRAYLAEYQADGSMSFAQGEIELSEQHLGKYRASTLSITAGPAVIMVAPVGRMIIGALGRVDMYRQGRPGEQDRILLLHMPTSATDPALQWMITLPPEVGAPVLAPAPRTRPGQQRMPPRQLRQRVPLTKAVLEQVLEFLLSR